jgi:tRNA threonylcarbamoyladenosine biosynthesis protein TsaE
VTQPIVTRSEDETAEAGERFAGRLSAGDVVLLYGDLGAGKTAFVRGLTLGLGADDDKVSSPTFTLIQEYRGGRLTLFHADLYRLTSREAADIGLDEIGEDGVLAVEWADRLDRAPAPAIVVRFGMLDEHSRRIVVSRNSPADSLAARQ